MLAEATMSDSGVLSGTGSQELIEEISDLLRTESGEGLLKRLFWQTLSFDRVSEPIPYSILPSGDRTHVADSMILARYGDIYVCYLRCLVSELSSGLEQPILARIGRGWPTALTVFSSFAGHELVSCF